MSLQNSCRDTVFKNSVNFICKDGVVSCDPTVLASVSQIWRNILMTTDEDTKYILAPDYTLKFMKSYLLSQLNLKMVTSVKFLLVIMQIQA